MHGDIANINGTALVFGLDHGWHGDIANAAHLHSLLFVVRIVSATGRVVCPSDNILVYIQGTKSIFIQGTKSSSLRDPHTPTPKTPILVHHEINADAEAGWGCLWADLFNSYIRDSMLTPLGLHRFRGHTFSPSNTLARDMSIQPFGPPVTIPRNPIHGKESKKDPTAALERKSWRGKRV